MCSVGKQTWIICRNNLVLEYVRDCQIGAACRGDSRPWLATVLACALRVRMWLFAEYQIGV